MLLGCFVYSLGYNFMNASMFSFSRKTKSFMIIFRRGCKFVRASNDYLENLVIAISNDPQ